MAGECFIHCAMPLGKSPCLDGRFSSGHLGLEEVHLSLKRRQFLVQRRQSRPAAHVERVEEVGDALDGPGNLVEVEIKD